MYQIFRINILKNIIILTILNLVFIFQLNAQQDNRILITGIVKNMNLEPIPFVHIIINKHKGTVCDNNGKFIYLGNPSDTIIFSVVGYKKGKYVIPGNISGKDYLFTKILLTDTVHLKEMLVLPWNSYKEFKDAFVKTKIPEDDYSRAYKNWDLIQKQYIQKSEDIDSPADPSIGFNYTQQKRNYQMYYAGQAQPISVLSPTAWYQLIQAIKRGDFKKKKKKK